MGIMDRLRRLEGALIGRARVIVVQVGQGDDAGALLKIAGIVPTPTDLLVTIAKPQVGGGSVSMV